MRRGSSSAMRGSPTNCGPMTDSASEFTEDAFLGGQLRLRQPRSGHRAGHDAMLLAAATPACPGDRVVEFGAGVGAAGLAVAKRVSGIKLVLVEIDAALAELARSNAASNAVAAETIVLDVAAAADAFAAAGLTPDSADVVLMNPPFNDAARQHLSPDVGRRLAHAAAPQTLSLWIAAAARLLGADGVLTLIWRADGLGEVLDALAPDFGGIAVLPVHPKPETPAIRVLVRAVRASRAPLALCPGLYLNDACGRPTPAAEAVLRGGGALRFAEN